MNKTVEFRGNEYEVLREKLVIMAHESFQNTKGVKFDVEFLRALNRLDINAIDVIKGGKNK